MKILVIVGTRPEAIKMAPLILAMQKEAAITLKVCITAQQRQMLDQVLDFFQIVPEYDLNIMLPNQTLNSLSGRLFQSIDEVYIDYKPDLVFVHGDTTTSTICAMAAYHRSIEVVHIEAGLRTYNKKAPFPEEVNRQITGRIADIHYAPTPGAKQNLLKEGVNDRDIFVTGNTVIDALRLGLQIIEQGYSDSEIAMLERIINTKLKLIVVTGHRRENFGEGFIQICTALKEIALFEGVQVIYPVHLNPNVTIPVHQLLGDLNNVLLIEPLSYPAFLYLMGKSYLIITDSGGVQEEAPSLGKPVLVMREVTERPEAVEAGTVKLVGTDKVKIVNAVSQLLNDPLAYEKMTQKHNPYGDGYASEKIIDSLLKKSKK